MAEFNLSRSYEQEEQKMDEEDRLTEEFDALKYFTMSKLKEFDREIQQLKKERKESDEIVSKEFGELKEKIEQLEEAAEAAKQKKVEEKPKHKMRISEVNTSDEMK
ncbi:hypothetical protein SNE40_005919 [Patella caerulea]|uniref:Uncharacterized protein n=1 Tax=Patella caerulea TaxID=87958 RepID=A0AAN8QAK9_PATCE